MLMAAETSQVRKIDVSSTFITSSREAPRIDVLVNNFFGGNYLGSISNWLVVNLCTKKPSPLLYARLNKC